MSPILRQPKVEIVVVICVDSRLQLLVSDATIGTCIPVAIIIDGD